MAIITQEILQGINKKELRAWEKLYAAFYPALCSYVDHILKDSDTSQDVVQETLIKVWNSEHVFPDIKDLTWYLYRSSYNNALYHLRTKNSHQQILQQIPAEEIEIPDEQFAFTVQEELIRQIYVYIEDLPEERKKIILLSLQGHSGNEIAEILGITIHTVKTQKNRCFKYLREKLKDSVLLFLI